MAFHVRDGLFIERLETGEVHIYIEKETSIIFNLILPPNEFASLVCAGSKDQELYCQWYAAMQLLGIDGYENGWDTHQKQKAYPAIPQKEAALKLCWIARNSFPLFQRLYSLAKKGFNFLNSFGFDLTLKDEHYFRDLEQGINDYDYNIEQLLNNKKL